MKREIDRQRVPVPVGVDVEPGAAAEIVPGLLLVNPQGVRIICRPGERVTTVETFPEGGGQIEVRTRCS